MLCLITGLLFGQELSNIERFREISENQTVTSIVVDDDNNKYLGTYNGLYKIDGETFNVDVLQEGEEVKALAWNRKSGVWAGLADNVVQNMDNGKSITLKDSVKIFCMAATPSQVWIGTNDGIYVISSSKYEIQKHYTSRNSNLLSDQINSLSFDPFKIKWVGTDQGVIRIDKKKWKLYEKKERITALGHSNEGMWVAGENEMWLVDEYNRWAPADMNAGLAKGEVKSIASDKKGNIYVASDVIVQFDPYTDRTTTLDESYGFGKSAQMALVVDKQDEVWIGSGKRGLYKVGGYDKKVRRLTAVMVVEREIDCSGGRSGALLVKPQGGTPPYRYRWEDRRIKGDNPQGLRAGSYKVTIVDSTGNKYAVETTLSEPRVLEVTATPLSPTSEPGKSDGSARAMISGGTAPYKINWDNGSTGASTSDLGAGTRTVTVTDSRGCAEEASVEIEETKLLANLKVEELEIGQTLRIEQLYFDADSATIKPSSHPTLDDIYEFLATNDGVVIEVGGHTNNIPSHDYCDRLSTDRARSVASYLLRKGIQQDRISFKGYGKRSPIASNQTPQGRKKNQRVELKILSLGE